MDTTQFQRLVKKLVNNFNKLQRHYSKDKYAIFTIKQISSHVNKCIVNLKMHHHCNKPTWSHPWRARGPARRPAARPPPCPSPSPPRRPGSAWPPQRPPGAGSGAALWTWSSGGRWAGCTFGRGSAGYPSGNLIKTINARSWFGNAKWCFLDEPFLSGRLLVVSFVDFILNDFGEEKKISNTLLVLKFLRDHLPGSLEIFVNYIHFCSCTCQWRFNKYDPRTNLACRRIQRSRSSWVDHSSPSCQWTDTWTAGLSPRMLGASGRGKQHSSRELAPRTDGIMSSMRWTDGEMYSHFLFPGHLKDLSYKNTFCFSIWQS